MTTSGRKGTRGRRLKRRTEGGLPARFIVRTKLDDVAFDEAPIDTKQVYELLLFWCVCPENAGRFGSCTVSRPAVVAAMEKKGTILRKSKLATIMNWLESKGLIGRPPITERQSLGAKKRQHEVKVFEVVRNEKYYKNVVAWQSLAHARAHLRVALEHSQSHEWMTAVATAQVTLPEVPSEYPVGHPEGGPRSPVRAPVGQQRTPSGDIREGEKRLEKVKQTPTASAFNLEDIELSIRSREGEVDLCTAHTPGSDHSDLLESPTPEAARGGGVDVPLPALEADQS